MTSSFRERLYSQFRKPRGVPGELAGWIMAHRPSNRERARWTVSLLDLKPTDSVLELGFGPGIAIREAARRTPSGRVCGVDHSETMLRQARRRNAAAVAEGRVDLRLGSAESLPDFPEGFDKIYAINTVGFWQDPVACFQSLQTKLRPGGLIVLTLQPRGAGASERTARASGERMAGQLNEASFSDVRIELRAMKPVPAVAVLARGVEVGG